MGVTIAAIGSRWLLFSPQELAKPGFDAAGQAMKDAEEALGEGSDGTDRAVEAQGRALRALQQGAQGLAIGLQHLLRDHRNNQQHPMDVGLYDLLADLADRAGVEPRYEIISGYRSPQTNAALHERSSGVAVHSMHLEGRAIDVRLKGVDCARLASLALKQSRGGVGFYARSDFVHVDTGRIRSWQG